MSRDASDESLRREHRDAGIRRTSTGTRLKQGDLILEKEADAALHNDCVHVKLTHERWTGLWTITAVIPTGLFYHVTLQGRRERGRRAEASHIKPYHLRPPSLRHGFDDEYAHFAWGPDLGLAAASTLASSLFTLVDRCTIQLPNVSWECRCRGRYLNGSLSGFITESECLDSFSPPAAGRIPCSVGTVPHSTTGPDPLQSQQAVNASQITEHTLYWRYPLGLWSGGTSPSDKEGSNVAGPKYMTTKLHTGGFDTRIETGKS